MPRRSGGRRRKTKLSRRSCRQPWSASCSQEPILETQDLSSSRTAACSPHVCRRCSSEPVFLSHPQEAALLGDPDSVRRDAIAHAITDGIDVWLRMHELGPLPDSMSAHPMMSKRDPLLEPARGSAAQTLASALLSGAARPDQVWAYVTEVYRLAPRVGLDPAMVVAQSALETGWWQSAAWIDHLNPAGIGITGSEVSVLPGRVASTRHGRRSSTFISMPSVLSHRIIRWPLTSRSIRVMRRLSPRAVRVALAALRTSPAAGLPIPTMARESLASARGSSDPDNSRLRGNDGIDRTRRHPGQLAGVPIARPGGDRPPSKPATEIISALGFEGASKDAPWRSPSDQHHVLSGKCQIRPLSSPYHRPFLSGSFACPVCSTPSELRGGNAAVHR